MIPYRLTVPENRTFVNGIRTDISSTSAQTAEALGFSNVPQEYADKTGPELLWSVIAPFVKLLEEDFDRGWEILMKWDHVPFRSYLLTSEGWPPSVIEFVETMCSQTNQYTLSFPEMIMQSMDFETKKLWTLEDGMDRLPQALARVVGFENITFGARVQKITQTSSGKLKLQAYRGDHVFEGIYDKILLATPPGAVRMISERPRWPLVKEQALRSMYYEALYKIGIRFKTRFWERIPKPSLGGQSTTDLPIRWIVYPSYGLNEKGPGVLLLYSWMTDASLWSSVTFEERVNLSLKHLAEVYADTDVDVFSEFIAADDTPWAERNPMGDAMFLPGQYTQFFEVARQPEGNIYFAGEHLSRHHTWIAGALDSANTAVQQMLMAWEKERKGKELRGIRPKPGEELLQPVPGLERGYLPSIGRPEAEPVNPEEERKNIIKAALGKIHNRPETFKDSIINQNTPQEVAA